VADAAIECINCAVCYAACDVVAANPDYLGPAPLAAIQIQGLEGHPELLALADSQQGVWRCHSAFECSAVCPSSVDPGWRIMDLRRQVTIQRLKTIIG
ncbi:MAG: 4Fe-4S dicluster domain-containing protein, partial [Caldilineae bacterium]